MHVSPGAHGLKSDLKLSAICLLEREETIRVSKELGYPAVLPSV